jgi:hypothetical protein
MRNVHSKKSLAAVVAKTAAEVGGAAAAAPLPARPLVVVHRAAAREVDVSQLPYSHRNPAV